MYQPAPFQRPQPQAHPSYTADPKINQTLQMSIVHQLPEPQLATYPYPPAQPRMPEPPYYEKEQPGCLAAPTMPGQPKPQVCYRCGDESPGYMKKSPGCVTLAWSAGLLLFGTWMCCVPFFVDGCLDTEEVCTRCGTIRNTNKAHCL